MAIYVWNDELGDYEEWTHEELLAILGVEEEEEEEN